MSSKIFVTDDDVIFDLFDDAVEHSKKFVHFSGEPAPSLIREFIETPNRWVVTHTNGILKMMPEVAFRG